MNSYLSAGMVVIYKHKILLVHPTNASWWGTYSIPKGKVEPGESPWEAALRECYEETGLKLDKKDTFCAGQIQYNRSKKSVMYFLAPLKENPHLGFPDNDEVDWCGFLTAEKAEKRILPQMRHLLEYLKGY